MIAHHCHFRPGDVVSIGLTGLPMTVEGVIGDQVSVAWWCKNTLYRGKFEARQLIHRGVRTVCTCRVTPTARKRA